MKRELPPSVPAKPYEMKRLRDPEFAAAYLSYTARSDDPTDFLYALREVTEAMGGIAEMAERTGLNRQQLYKTLSRAGNPEFRSLSKILEASGLAIQFVAKRTRRSTSSRSRQKA